VSPNTIRKYLRSDVIEPEFQVPDHVSKLDPYAEKLSAWLRREAERPRKQLRTAKQLHGDLVSLGSNGACILETGNDSFRFQTSSGQEPRSRRRNPNRKQQPGCHPSTQPW
jgi:hypothetical protein